MIINNNGVNGGNGLSAIKSPINPQNKLINKGNCIKLIGIPNNFNNFKVSINVYNGINLVFDSVKTYTLNIKIGSVIQ